MRNENTNKNTVFDYKNKKVTILTIYIKKLKSKGDDDEKEERKGGKT